MSTTDNHTGWISFAGYLMIVVGIFQAIAGLVALFQPDIYLTTPSHLFIFDYTQWGWTHLLIGAILIGSSFSLFAGKIWGRIVAITLASLSAIVNFAFINAYPLWSMVIIAMDLFIIYAVAVYGGNMREQ